MGDLSGKTALVTGAGRGIGAGIARRLARDGAQVICNYSRAAAEAEALAAVIGGGAFAVKADITDLAHIEAMFGEIGRRVGHLDILVNNAGRGGSAPLAETTPEMFDAIFGLNTRGTFFVTKAASALLRDGGRIINISSTTTRVRMAGLATYAASKSAVEAFTRNWAAEFAPRRITVNSVVPSCGPGLKTPLTPMPGMSDNNSNTFSSASSLTLAATFSGFSVACNKPSWTLLLLASSILA